MSLLIAATVAEAVDALAAGATPIAGGTDLVVGARHGKAALPASLVAVDRIDELRNVDSTADGLRIGAAVNHATLMTDAAVVAQATALGDGAALVGSPATRHLGTIGGNLMNASPAMDTGAPLLTLGASVDLVGPGGSRNVALGDLWEGPGRTSAAADELCVAVRIPAATGRGSAYVRLEYRRAMEIAVVGAAATVALDASGQVESVRVALSAVGPTIIDCGPLEVAGHSDDEVAAAAVEAARAAATPISDLRASASYRVHTVGVMAGRAASAALRRARGETITVPVNRALGIGAAS